MNVTVVLEQRFDQTPDGAVWTTSVFARPFWDRYLEVFDSVNVLARVCQVSAVPTEWRRVDGDPVTVTAVPYYVGPWQYLQRYRDIRATIRQALDPHDAVIIRVPSPIGGFLVPALRKTGQPYALEVVGDPYDVFAPGGIDHLLRPFLRWWFRRQLQRQCRDAAGVAYVTTTTLQRRYPASPRAMTTHYSSVELPDSAFVTSPRAADHHSRRRSLVTVASLEQLYKAPDLLIDAVAALVREGLDLHLTIVGEGKFRSELERRARGHDLTNRIIFTGSLPPGDAVRLQLDQADLFVLPSRTEGLPRAIIEAMARGLPCIGSAVGGIPELIGPSELVPPGDIQALAAKIREVVTDPQRMAMLSKENLEKAAEYREPLLRERRIAFYRHLRLRTTDWIHTRTNR